MHVKISLLSVKLLRLKVKGLTVLRKITINQGVEVLIYGYGVQ